MAEYTDDYTLEVVKRIAERNQVPAIKIPFERKITIKQLLIKCLVPVCEAHQSTPHQLARIDAEALKCLNLIEATLFPGLDKNLNEWRGGKRWSAAIRQRLRAIMMACRYEPAAVSRRLNEALELADTIKFF